MTTFTHHPRNGEPWEFDPTMTYALSGHHFKPRGLWLSVDDDWLRWCNDNDMDWAVVEPIEFDVNTDRCLWLKTVDDIDRFHAEYVGDQDSYRIDWRPLTQSYAGIIIAPYQWARRLQGKASEWYYPWDAASACVWDLSVLRVRDRSVAVSS